MMMARRRIRISVPPMSLCTVARSTWRRSSKGTTRLLHTMMESAMHSTITMAVEAERPPRKAISAKVALPAWTGSASTKVSPSAVGGSSSSPATAIGMTNRLMATR